MRLNKTISLDENTIELLNEVPNASRLIENLLNDYFGLGQNLKRTELERKIKELDTEIRDKIKTFNNLYEALKELNKKEAENREIFKNIPRKILDDFHSFRDMTEETLIERFNSIYTEEYPKLTKEEVLKAFRKIKGEE